MRKFTFFNLALMMLISVLFSTTGCVDKKPQAVDTLAVDSIEEDSVDEDTLSNMIAESPMSKSADELFDDFIFNFAANRKLQLKRVKFPLPVMKHGEQTDEIKKEQWKMDYFFMKQGYFTLIFDNLKQMEVMKDTSVNQVTVEKILFKNKTVKQYIFNRINGEFMLTSIVYQPIHESVNGSFLQFYQRFAVDSAFQVRSMNETVEFTAPDPDDDFGTITGSIVPEQWSAFKPPIIPKGNIYNIVYGQKHKRGNQKIFVVRGIATDLENIMVFRRQKSEWKLMKFNS